MLGTGEVAEIRNFAIAQAFASMLAALDAALAACQESHRQRREEEKAEEEFAQAIFFVNLRALLGLDAGFDILYTQADELNQRRSRNEDQRDVQEAQGDEADEELAEEQLRGGG